MIEALPAVPEARRGEAIAKVLSSTQFILGPEVQLLEEEIANYLGVKYAIGVNSGTDEPAPGLSKDTELGMIATNCSILI